MIVFNTEVGGQSGHPFGQCNSPAYARGYCFPKGDQTASLDKSRGPLVAKIRFTSGVCCINDGIIDEFVQLVIAVDEVDHLGRVKLMVLEAFEILCQRDDVLFDPVLLMEAP